MKVMPKSEYINLLHILITLIPAVRVNWTHPSLALRLTLGKSFSSLHLNFLIWKMNKVAMHLLRTAVLVIIFVNSCGVLKREPNTICAQ